MTNSVLAELAKIRQEQKQQIFWNAVFLVGGGLACVYAFGWIGGLGLAALAFFSRSE